jgi:hypothetical protein
MLTTSGTHEFNAPKSNFLIDEAYERIGIIPGFLSDQQIVAAQRSMNFILQSWINRGLNLWTIKQGMLALNNNQSAYTLPLYTTDILEATTRTSNRNLGGTPFSSAGGIASNAFDNNPATACTQTSPSGYISYSWGSASFSISMVGVQSNATFDYTLVFEYSLDGLNWIQAGAPPTQSYPQGVIQWFVIAVPTPAANFRIRETGLSILNVQELYFNSLLYDTVMTRRSRADYVSIPNKGSTSRPSSFYVDRQITPTVYLWPTPSAFYNNMYFTYINQIEDIGSMIDSAQVPARFLEPLVSSLAYLLSIKQPGFDLNKIAMLNEHAKEEFRIAAIEDRERVPLKIYGNYQGWPQS